MNDDLQKSINSTAKDLYGIDLSADLTHPDPKFGDWSTNVALRIASQVNRAPREVAQELIEKLPSVLGGSYKISIAGPGFINIELPDDYFTKGLASALTQSERFGHNENLKDKKVLVEGTDPNPFKQLHVGHIYSNTVGEAISGLHEASGAKVIRVNYQGDVGMHVANSLWGMEKLLDGMPLDEIAPKERAKFLGQAYALGSSSFKDDPKAKEEITALNKKIYQKDPEILEAYNTGRQWSLDYFEVLYARLQTSFDKYYFEHESGPIGLKLIEANMQYFDKSDGAVVYKGEQDGLHTRVFINSKGLPTYECKDLGLASMKERDFSPDISITFTGNEITEYFKVIKAVLHKINPEWAAKIKHIPHGMVRLPEGKMSSRTGDIITAESILDETYNQITARSPDSPSANDNTLGAIKYAFLKHRIGGDIAFNIEDSISLEGNSGPYLQYAHARAKRIIENLSSTNDQQAPNIQSGEKEMTRLILLFPEIIAKAQKELSPHSVCTYLYQLTQEFNRFYENNHVIGDDRELIRGQIVRATQMTIRNGLKILNIPSPDTM